MAMNNIATASRNSMCDALVDDVDVGSTDASGDIQVYTAAFATLLAELAYSAPPAFGAAAAGVATANAIADDTSADNSGTAAVCRIRDRDNATVWEGTVTATAGGGDIEFNTITFTSGDTVSITAQTVTMPAG